MGRSVPGRPGLVAGVGALAASGTASGRVPEGCGPPSAALGGQRAHNRWTMCRTARAGAGGSGLRAARTGDGGGARGKRRWKVRHHRQTATCYMPNFVCRSISLLLEKKASHGYNLSGGRTASPLTLPLSFMWSWSVVVMMHGRSICRWRHSGPHRKFGPV